MAKNGPAVNEDDFKPKVDFEDPPATQYDYLRAKPRAVKPLPYKEPLIDLNSKRDTSKKVTR